MATNYEIDESVRRISETPKWLLEAKACPECFALVPADQGAISAHVDWHEKLKTSRG